VQQLVRTGPRPEDVSSGRLLANLLTLGRDLRGAGLNVGSGQVLSLVEAISAVDPRRKDDFYAAAKATLVNGPDQIPVFDAIFDQFWAKVTNSVQPVEFAIPDPRLDQGAPDQQPSGQQEEESGGETGTVEKSQEKAVVAIEDNAETSENAADSEEVEAPPEDVMVFSAREVLRKKDFSQFTDA